MKNFKISLTVYLILAGVFIIFPLNRVSSQEDTDHQNKNIEHSNHEESLSLSLNDGKRWQMDDHTRKMTTEMLATFSTSDHSTVTGLNFLGKQLREQLDKLIKGCTMTGQSHEQLHIFLNSYMPAVNSLIVSNDINTGTRNAIAIKKLLESYQQYFE
jgi:hypothetical protein